MRIIVLGASGMLGSMIVDVFSRDESFEVTAAARSQKVLEKLHEQLPNLNIQVVESFRTNLVLDFINGHDWVINAIGITKPLIHDQNPADVEKATWINSLLPYLIGGYAASVDAQVLQIATDCVYSGGKGAYLETDLHDALDVYGKTKSLGESAQPNVHHLRCSIIGPEPKEHKFLLEWFRNQPRDAKVTGYVNHLWNGITTLHFAKICQGILKMEIALPHVQHLVPTGAVTKAGMLRIFARAYNRQDIHVTDTEAKYSVDRTLGTSNVELNHRLWKAAGYETPPTIPEMIAELSGWKTWFQ